MQRRQDGRLRLVGLCLSARRRQGSARAAHALATARRGRCTTAARRTENWFSGFFDAANDDGRTTADSSSSPWQTGSTHGTVTHRDEGDPIANAPTHHGQQLHSQYRSTPATYVIARRRAVTLVALLLAKVAAHVSARACVFAGSASNCDVPTRIWRSAAGSVVAAMVRACVPDVLRVITRERECERVCTVVLFGVCGCPSGLSSQSKRTRSAAVGAGVSVAPDGDGATASGVRAAERKKSGASQKKKLRADGEASEAAVGAGEAMMASMS
jgi:hypothetical protein